MPIHCAPFGVRLSGRVGDSGEDSLERWLVGMKCKCRLYGHMLCPCSPFPLTPCQTYSENKSSHTNRVTKGQTAKTWCSTRSTSPGPIAAAAKQLQTIRPSSQAEPGQMMTNRERGRERDGERKAGEEGERGGKRRREGQEGQGSGSCTPPWCLTARCTKITASRVKYS